MPANAAGNKARAEAEAAQLLAEVRLPAGAGEIATPPAALHGMQEGLSSTAALIDKPRFWRVPLSVDAALAWIRAHPPAGLTLGGSLSETGPGVYTRGIVFTDRDTGNKPNCRSALQRSVRVSARYAPTVWRCGLIPAR